MSPCCFGSLFAGPDGCTCSLPDLDGPRPTDPITVRCHWWEVPRSKGKGTERIFIPMCMGALADPEQCTCAHEETQARAEVRKLGAKVRQLGERIHALRRATRVEERAYSSRECRLLKEAQLWKWRALQAGWQAVPRIDLDLPKPEDTPHHE